jgi:hypothetical protein
MPAILHGMGINTLRQDGWEADDLIATLTSELADIGLHCTVFSRDKVPSFSAGSVAFGTRGIRSCSSHAWP